MEKLGLGQMHLGPRCHVAEASKSNFALLSAMLVWIPTQHLPATHFFCGPLVDFLKQTCGSPYCGEPPRCEPQDTDACPRDGGGRCVHVPRGARPGPAPRHTGQRRPAPQGGCRQAPADGVCRGGTAGTTWPVTHPPPCTWRERRPALIQSPHAIREVNNLMRSNECRNS